MSENNKSYRIRTNVGSEYNSDIKLDVNLLQNYDIFEILSLKIGTENLYKYHTSKYGCVVGRVLANGGVGVPNAKISIFIKAEDADLNDPIFSYLYPYNDTRTKNRDNVRYNLLTDKKIDECHQNVGTFPNKRLVLDDDNIIEVFDKYYKYTTTTNGSGDYMIFGVPVGNNILHSDVDLSDIGILSQKPRDLFYKGYTQTQFENASQFKASTDLDSLTQIISQDSSVYVYPFWGDEDENEGQIKITRNDIDVSYKFEPTCIFIGSIVSDEKSNAISKNCIPHERMGKMDRLTTGKGTIEMIRKTVGGKVESKSIQGNELIDGNGTWCYQIPMNLDYVATDEYGNLVPTDNYDKGIPTRTSVRFRISLSDYESDHENAHLVKVLVPNNPQLNDDTINFDYEFGSNTKEESFKDLFWNNVYTVKQFVPRFQKGNRQRNKNFTGFKAVNVNGANNPLPYNNMRINLTFLFVFQCLIFKSMIMIVKFLNKLVYIFNKFTSGSNNSNIIGGSLVYIAIDGGMCPALDGNYIAPGAKDGDKQLTQNTYHSVIGDEGIDLRGGSGTSDSIAKALSTDGTSKPYDKKSSDNKNGFYDKNKEQISTGITVETVIDGGGDTESITQETSEGVKIYNNEDYFVKCVELQFAMEYEVIQFDFYNDWINGMIYIPRWFAEVRKNKTGMYYCGETFNKYRYLTQQCALGYDKTGVLSKSQTENKNIGCTDNGKQQCHKIQGRKQVGIFKGDKGIVKKWINFKGQNIFYLRPSETISNIQTNREGKIKVNLFSTDVVMLGSVSDCNIYGIPKVKGYTSSTYRMPPPTGEIVSDSQEMDFSTGKLEPDVAYNFALTYLNNLNKKSIYEVLSSEKYVVDPCKCANTTVGQHTVSLMLERCLGSDYLNKKGENGKVYFWNLVHLESYFKKNPFSDTSNIRDYIGYFNYNYLGTVDNDGGSENFDKKTREDIIDRCEKNVDEANNYYKILIKEIDISEYSNDRFFVFNKKPAVSTDGEKVVNEMSGIDWGYNPFEFGEDDDTSLIPNQIGGHFLEIGCTFSLSNIKSCVNLQRICELGTEMSQSHYYDVDNYLDPSGIIGKREIIDGGIRNTFATLNSKSLKTELDFNKLGYKRYDLIPYIPNQFMGDLSKSGDIIELKTKNGLIEEQSKSYKAFRFGIKDNDVSKKFLKYENNMYYMPQYENSFYFYFGLKDGNTAIDRLYSEYYCECNTDDTKIEQPFATLYSDRIDEKAQNATSIIRYVVYNFGNLKEINQTKCEGVEVEYYENNNFRKLEFTTETLTNGKFKINSDNNIVINRSGIYRLTFINNKEEKVSARVTVLSKKNPTLTIDASKGLSFTYSYTGLSDIQRYKLIGIRITNHSRQRPINLEKEEGDYRISDNLVTITKNGMKKLGIDNIESNVIVKVNFEFTLTDINNDSATDSCITNFKKPMQKY